jgi:NAD(P)H dehydrogenase (quinone)
MRSPHRPARTLVVVCHPRADSLCHAASERVQRGLRTQGAQTRLIDLYAEAFEPRLSLHELRHYGTMVPDELAAHIEALQWAERVVFVHPTWFSAQPARLKGWFDRVWLPGVAFDPPPSGRGRLRGRLHNIRRLEIVTTHGSSKWVNRLQVHSGRRVVFRNLRQVCHPLCRTRFTALYNLDRHDGAAISAWLDQVETRFSR